MQIENGQHFVLASLSPMSLTIRPYQAIDLQSLRDLTVEAFEGVSLEHDIERVVGEFGGHDWRWRKARHVDADVDRDAEGIFVAEGNGAVVGYVSTWIDAEAGVGFIPNLAVAASCRGQGIGRQLLNRAIEHFRSRGVRVARIETMAQNDVGRHLYPSLGFQEVAQQVHYCLDLGEEKNARE